MSQLNALHNALALLSIDQTLQRTIAKMDKMREEYDTQLGYELYQEGVKFEKRLAEVRDEAKMAAMEEVLEAKHEVEEMRAKLFEAVNLSAKNSCCSFVNARDRYMECGVQLRVHHEQD
eukprot:scaffold154527_cov22-Prasinocladus_malaysianus.AAC.1